MHETKIGATRNGSANVFTNIFIPTFIISTANLLSNLQKISYLG